MTNSTSGSQNPKKEKYWLVVAAVVLLWLVNWVLIKLTSTDRGTIGDMFGVVNSLFSGLAFAYLIISVRIQGQELSLQRQELELTRDELKGQKLELSSQSDTFQLQQFENTFFELLKVHNQIVDAIEITFEGNKYRGRSSFRILYTELKQRYGVESFYPRPREDQQVIDSAYGSFFSAYQDQIGHYFRNLYHIHKFIKESDIKNKKRYTSLVRAQISSYEFVLIFYNCLSEFGSQKFKPLLEEYQGLENMNTGQIFSPDHIALYNESAFGDSE